MALSSLIPKERPQQGGVVAVGPTASEKAGFDLKGDIVIYSKYGGTEIKYEGEEYLILNCDSDILALSAKIFNLIGY